MRPQTTQLSHSQIPELQKHESKSQDSCASLRGMNMKIHNSLKPFLSYRERHFIHCLAEEEGRWRGTGATKGPWK
ncbi:unnamed protein product, partial [Gulo gulo]